MDSEAKKEFDIKVTHRDERTGLITHKTPYILRVSGAEGGGKTRTWERPPGSGNLFDKKGNPVGRRVKDAQGRWSTDPKAEHVAFVPPLTEDQKLSRSVVEKDQRISALEAELASLRVEADKKSAANQKKI